MIKMVSLSAEIDKPDEDGIYPIETIRKDQIE